MNEIRSTEVTQAHDVCTVKVSTLNAGLAPCNKPCTYLSAAQAQAAGRGRYSGWYHVSAAAGQTHRAVPKRWVS